MNKPTGQKECCKKCLGEIQKHYSDGDFSLDFFCDNPNCPCHTQDSSSIPSAWTDHTDQSVEHLDEIREMVPVLVKAAWKEEQSISTVAAKINALYAEYLTTERQRGVEEERERILNIMEKESNKYHLAHHTRRIDHSSGMAVGFRDAVRCLEENTLTKDTPNN